jgi:hypothetical protein
MQLTRSWRPVVMIRYSVFAALLASLLFSGPASAHCDTTKGPVVTAARAALEAGDPDLVLHWVRLEDEVAVRGAFQRTMEARALGPAAKELADRYFFETLVRIHRAGEGAAYAGLTDGDPEPIIAATDRALEVGSAGELEQQLVTAVRSGLAERFAAARAAKAFRPGDIAGGRAFVAAYVPFTHWVEGVFTVAQGAGEHHGAAIGEDEAAHAVVHQPGGHPATGAAAEPHGPAIRRYVPWILAGLLAIAALVEGALLLRRRRPAAA